MEYNGEKFEVWIGNLGKYNEGALVGEWVELPVTKEDYLAVLNRIGISDEPQIEYYNINDGESYSLMEMQELYKNESLLDKTNGMGFNEWIDNKCINEFEKSESYYEETFNADYNNPFGFALELGEYENIEQLNKLAAGLEKADDEHVMDVVQALMEDGYDLETSIANAVENNCYLTEEVHDKEDVGRWVLDQMGGDIPEDTLETYFDYASFGGDLKYDSYEMDTDERETAYYDLKEAIDTLKDETSKYTVQFVDENGEKVSPDATEDLDDLDEMVAGIIVYKDGVEIDEIDPSHFDMKVLLEEYIIPNEGLDIENTAVDLEGSLEDYMSVSYDDKGKMIFENMFNEEMMPDVEYIDRDQKYVSAGEYYCGDEYATDYQIGAAVVDDIGINDIGNKETYFDYESFGRDCLMDGYLSLTSFGLLDTSDIDSNLNLDDILDEDEWKFEPQTEPKYTADRAVSGETKSEKIPNKVNNDLSDHDQR